MKQVKQTCIPPKFKESQKPLLPYLDIGFALLVEFTGISHLVRFVISRTEEMGHAHRLLDKFDIFTTMLRDGAVDGSAPAKPRYA
jgi:hypothetical protein